MDRFSLLWDGMQLEFLASFYINFATRMSDFGNPDHYTTNSN